MKPFVAFLVVFFSIVSQAFSASDYFLKIEGVKGEVLFSVSLSEQGRIPISAQVGKITVSSNGVEIMSWSWGATNSSSATTKGGMGAGKVSMQDFHRSSSSSTTTTYLCPKGQPVITSESAWSSSSSPSIKFDISSSSVSYVCNSKLNATWDLKKGTK